jgi:hypothetical protein
MAVLFQLRQEFNSENKSSAIKISAGWEEVLDMAAGNFRTRIRYFHCDFPQRPATALWEVSRCANPL